jgi:hypothetical protein
MTTTAPATTSMDGQSLADGAAGVALLHIERARTGQGSWAAAHALITQAATAPIDAGDHAGLYYGAPAVTFMLHTANTDGQPRYISALTHL